MICSICSPVRRSLVQAFSIAPSYCTQKDLMKLHLRTAFTLSFSTFFFALPSSCCAKSVPLSLSFAQLPETPFCREENEISVLYPIFSALLHFPLRRGGRKEGKAKVGRSGAERIQSHEIRMIPVCPRHVVLTSDSDA